MSDVSLPKHIALIPDGNRRWAKAHNLPMMEGHKRGYDNLKTTADLAVARGVKHLTAYIFSTENWRRTADEVKYLMGLVNWVLTDQVKDFHANGYRLKFFGSPDKVDSKIVKGIAAAESLTKDNTKATLNICFNYGGRAEIVAAVNGLIKQGAAEVTEDSFGRQLQSTGQPDPDLIVRTGGERRLSNFLLWQSAYSELYFTDVLWPDFDEVELDKALADYADRQRRFGA